MEIVLLAHLSKKSGYVLLEWKLEANEVLARPKFMRVDIIEMCLRKSSCKQGKEMSGFKKFWENF
jgi:hypothetical protein